MPGFSTITGDESIMWADNISFDGTERGGKLTTDGELLIGSTASPHIRKGTLTAGTGISITNGAGTIQIDSTFNQQASSITTNTTNFNGWLTTTNTTVQSALDELDDSRRATEVTGATQAISTNRGYIANRGTLVTFTLPTTSLVGDEIEITGSGAGGWKIEQAANQYIAVISTATTTGVAGSLASTQRYDSVRMKCKEANLGWVVCGGTGNWTIV